MPIDKSMLVFFSRPFLFQIFSLTLSQMHVVNQILSESVFHVGNLLYPSDHTAAIKSLLTVWALLLKVNAVRNASGCEGSQ